MVVCEKCGALSYGPERFCTLCGGSLRVVKDKPLHPAARLDSSEPGIFWFGLQMALEALSYGCLGWFVLLLMLIMFVCLL